MDQEYVHKLDSAAKFLQHLAEDRYGAYLEQFEPLVGVVLGSGLGAFAESLQALISVPYGEIPLFPISGVEGHDGRMCFGVLEGGDCDLAVMQGRVHYYEGFAPQEVVFPIRTMIRMGVKMFIITHAVGAINESLKPGDFMVFADHMNLMGANPLHGPNHDKLGPRFLDMSRVYDEALQVHALDCMKALDLQSRHPGVHAALAGPTYETPAEIRMLRMLGADTVGMGIEEVIAARHMGVKVLGLGCVTNMAAGISQTPLSHEEVKETAARAEEQFCALLTRIIETLPKEPEE